MKEYIMKNKENKVAIMKLLYRQIFDAPYQWPEVRKQLVHEKIFTDINSGINEQYENILKIHPIQIPSSIDIPNSSLERILYRGIVIPNDYGEVVEPKKFCEILNTYATGSFSEDFTIANKFAEVSPDGNLDIHCYRYYQVIIKLVDGFYIDISKLANELDKDKQSDYNRFYKREKEYYCFVHAYQVVKLVEYEDEDVVQVYIDKFK